MASLCRIIVSGAQKSSCLSASSIFSRAQSSVAPAASEAIAPTQRIVKKHDLKSYNIEGLSRYHMTEEDFAAANASPAVRQLFHAMNASQEEVNKLRIRGSLAKFARHETDTGSSEVQVAVLTDKINYMMEHLKRHHKDVSSERGLLGMVNQRKKLLKYLKNSDFERYWKLTKALNLR